MERICCLDKAARKNAVNFAREKEGAQYLEYGLIITLVSAALVVALQILGGSNVFGVVIARVTSCLTASTCA